MMFQCGKCEGRFDSEEPQKYCSVCHGGMMIKRWAIAAVTVAAAAILWVMLKNSVQ